MIRQSRLAPFIMLNESLGASDLSGSPMAINGMKVLIRAAENGGITLTKSGAFYRKFVTWAAEDFQWPGYETEELYALNKVLNEQDFIPLSIMHELMIGARLLRHTKGKALTMKAGKAMIGDHGALQAELFDTYFLALDHGAYERFPIDHDDPDFVHFLGVAHNRLDDWVPLTELAGWCLPIDMITNYRFSPLEDACYYLLSRLVRPLLWLGMIERYPGVERYPAFHDLRYRKTPLYDRFLHFNFTKAMSGTIH
ncbi:hypothetical protein ABMA46_08215 [Mesorhizobium sp. CN5-321]|uniref:hypothetical protein n=1 Tax=Mesorhizobium hunchu TaxID=3157708 RepID=UPI0032B83A03